MKKYQGRGARATAAKAGLSTPSLGGLLIGGALTVLVAQPAWAAPTQITGVRINPTSTGIDLILETQAGDRPQVFAVPRGNSWVADVINAQLRVPEGTTFTRTNPAPGIASISIAPLDTNSVRVTITATDQAISGEVIRREATGIAFSISTGASAAVPPQIAPAPQPPVTQAPAVPLPGIQNGAPILPPSAQVVPPFLPRAIAPPVGDIAVSNIDATPGAVDLGVAELVPRLVLRDAPVRDVLALLARVANLNVAFAEGEALATPAAPGATGTGGDATISLDIENEPVQDVFNYVLRVTGLQSNRVGRTIFIGRNLPTGAQDLVMRTLRLNQLKATMAETNIESTMQTNVGIGSGVAAGGSQSTIARTVNQSRSVPMRGGLQMLELLGANGGGTEQAQAAAAPGANYNLLRGLQVTADGRTNSITLLGPPRLVDIATSYLRQHDVRQRQVAVNVRIVEVNLLNQDNVGASFSFGIADSFFSVDQGQLTANFGQVQPPNTTTVRTNQFGRPIVENPLSGVDPFLNPQGTQLQRDPFTGEFVPVQPNQPGTIFGPGGSPTRPGITGISPQQLPAGASPTLYLDAQGFPRPTNELTIGGGAIPPLINPEGNLVQVRPLQVPIAPQPGTAAQPPLYFDFQGNPRLASQLAAPTPGATQFQGFTGSIPPLLSPTGDPVQARAFQAGTNPVTGQPFQEPLFLDVSGVPRSIRDLTLTGGPFRPLFEQNELVQVGLETGLVPFIGQAAQFAYQLPQVFQYPRQFLAQLRAQVLEDNAKILTDPTLIVQEGSQAQVNLTQGIFTGFRSVITVPTQGPAIQTQEPTTGEAGIILNIAVDQVDDNGFVNMSVSPEVSSPGERILNPNGTLATQLINRRRLETGNVRLRDGQTLILTGIIQDQDRETVTKVPILGDLPIIGSLFRQRSSDNRRTEVIILVTPEIIDDSENANFGYGSVTSPQMQRTDRKSVV